MITTKVNGVEVTTAPNQTAAKEYTATTVRFSPQGEKLEEVRDFANDWNGFKEASKFVEGADEYAIWYEDKIIDFSK